MKLTPRHAEDFRREFESYRIGDYDIFYGMLTRRSEENPDESEDDRDVLVAPFQRTEYVRVYKVFKTSDGNFVPKTIFECSLIDPHISRELKAIYKKTGCLPDAVRAGMSSFPRHVRAVLEMCNA